MDVYFGIPNAKFLALQFPNIRKSFVNLLRQLVVSNRLLHVGIMQYSDSANLLLNLDRTYNRDAIEGVINREMGLYGAVRFTNFRIKLCNVYYNYYISFVVI